MANRHYHRPLVVLLFALVLGIVTGSRFPGHTLWAGLTAAFVLGWIGYRICKRKSGAISPLILFYILGYLCLQPWVAPSLPGHHVARHITPSPIHVTGEIAGPPLNDKRRLRFVLNVASLSKNGQAFDANGRLAVSVWNSTLELNAGDRIAFRAKIRPIRSFNNPGRFDYRRYMHFKGIRATAHVSAARMKLLARSEQNKPGRIQRARRAITRLIDRTSADADVRSVYKALIVGDRQHISATLREAFNRSGASHLLAISGLHIGIVATVAFTLLYRLLSHVKGLLWDARVRKVAAVLTLLPVLIYGFLAGMSPATQRAVIMVAVFLLAFLLEREMDPLNTLAAAAMVILVVHPPALFSISFQLSFVAVASILFGLGWIHAPHASQQGGPARLRRLVLFLLVSAFAILGTLPIVMFYFNQVSTVGLFANLLLIPLVGFCVVPLGLVSVFVFPLSTALASGCLDVGAFFLTQALFLVDLFAGLPFAAFKTITPTPVEITCFYVAAASLEMWLHLNRQAGPAAGSLPAPGGPVPGNVFQRFYQHFFSPRRLALVIVAMTVIVSGIDAAYWCYKRFWHSDFRVTAIDVGQGTATLLELPKGITMLIDGGGFPDNSTFDVGARIIAPFLWRKKIMSIDTMVLSHPNSDHLNGLLFVAEHFAVKEIWTNSQASETKGYRRFTQIIRTRDIPAPRFSALPRARNVNGVRIQLLHPPPHFIESGNHGRKNDTNNNSLVVKATFGATSFLFPGDIMIAAEKKLAAAANGRLKSRVLFAPHHGSKSSSSKPFLAHVDPQVVVISAGWQNRFHFPHPQVLERYKNRGCRVFSDRSKRRHRHIHRRAGALDPALSEEIGSLTG